MQSIQEQIRRWSNDLASLKKKNTIWDMQARGKIPGCPCVGSLPRPCNVCAPNRIRPARFTAPNWKQALLCVLAMGISALPFYAQKGAPTGGGTHAPSRGRPSSGVYYPPVNTGRSNEPTWQTTPDVPPLPKPTIPNDEQCFPWKLSESRATTVSVARLQIPSNARGEYEKACEASNKNRFDEAERHAHVAIDKFQNYAAAWVMLGVILEEQHKSPEARDACSHAVSVDSTYLPGYLCEAEFAVRNQDWKHVLDSANLAMGLNSEGDAYAYYYRATAYLNMDNIVEAKKSALQAAEVDATHSEPSIYFLQAQIYEREGDWANAISRMQQLLKRHIDRQQEDKVKKYLAQLESEQSAK